MAKKKTKLAKSTEAMGDAVGAVHARITELEASVQELVDAICAVRDGMRKESLEALPPMSRIAMDLALVHAKKLSAKGLDTV